MSVRKARYLYVPGIISMMLCWVAFGPLLIETYTRPRFQTIEINYSYPGSRWDSVSSGYPDGSYYSILKGNTGGLYILSGDKSRQHDALVVFNQEVKQLMTGKIKPHVIRLRFTWETRFNTYIQAINICRRHKAMCFGILGDEMRVFNCEAVAEHKSSSETQKNIKKNH